MKYLILFILFSVPAFAQECPVDHLSELKDLKDLELVIGWNAATDADIKKAFCTQKVAPTSAEMTKWMNDHQSTPNISRKVNGISFENESIENIEAFRKLTTYVDILGKLDPTKHKDFTSTCKKVDCAVTQIFGKDVGQQLLFIQRKYGMNGSHIIKEKTEAAAWKKNELDDLMLSLSDFPEGVIPFQDSRPLIHAPRGLGSGNTLANAIVTIFDLWNGESAEQRRATLTHELGHAISGVTETGSDPAWQKLSGWTTKSAMVSGKKVEFPTATIPGAIVSKYGLTNSEEDLAETVVAYRYNPQLLKTASPDKYKMIKNVIFDGVEYTSEAACKSPSRTSSALKTKIADKVKNWSPTPEELKEIANRCSQRAAEDLIANNFMDLGDPYFKSCYQNSVKQQTAEFLKKELKGLPYEKHLDPMIRNAFSEIAPEKLAEIAGKAQDTHRKTFRGIITKALNEGLYCKPDFLKYAYQAFNKDDIGVESYMLSDEGLNKVMASACASKSNKSFQVNQMIK